MLILASHIYVCMYIEGALEKGMATHFSILAWEIPWTEGPGGLQCMGSQRVWYNWVINTITCRGKLCLEPVWKNLGQFVALPSGFLPIANIAHQKGPSDLSPQSWSRSPNLNFPKSAMLSKDFKLSLLFLKMCLFNWLCWVFGVAWAFL